MPALLLYVAQGCFATAIRRYEFAGAFRGVFPVKCNHDRRLILNMLEAGRESGVGLECGSKAVRTFRFDALVCGIAASPLKRVLHDLLSNQAGNTHLLTPTTST